MCLLMRIGMLSCVILGCPGSGTIRRIRRIISGWGLLIGWLPRSSKARNISSHPMCTVSACYSGKCLPARSPTSSSQLPRLSIWWVITRVIIYRSLITRMSYFLRYFYVVRKGIRRKGRLLRILWSCWRRRRKIIRVLMTDRMEMMIYCLRSKHINNSPFNIILMKTDSTSWSQLSA